MNVGIVVDPNLMLRATALLPLPQASLGGEGWGEGAACRTASALWNCKAQPPHPTLSPIASDREEGLRLDRSRDRGGICKSEFAHAQ